MKLNKRKWKMVGTMVLWVGIITYLGITIAFVKNKRLIIVQTTVDLLENNTYQKITSFNY